MKNLLNRNKAKRENFKPLAKEQIDEEKEVVKSKLDKLIPFKKGKQK